MSREDEVSDAKIEIVAKMVRKSVIGSHHKQRDTIKKWCGGFDGDILEEAIDELVRERVIHEKGRGTIHLPDQKRGKEYLEEHGEDDEFFWF